MKLNELFDKVLPWEIYSTSTYVTDYKFLVDGVGKYYVTFNMMGDNSDVWEIDFALVDAEKYTHDIVGTGGKQVQIFSTILDIIKDFEHNNKSKVGKFVFTAKEPSRVKLYRRLIKMFGRPYTEETIEQFGNVITEFTIKVGGA